METDLRQVLEFFEQHFEGKNACARVNNFIQI